MKTAKTLSWWVVAFGAWEFVAPFILRYSAKAGALWDAIIVGTVLVVLAGWAALSNQPSTNRRSTTAIGKRTVWSDDRWPSLVPFFEFGGAWVVISTFSLSVASLRVIGEQQFPSADETILTQDLPR